MYFLARIIVLFITSLWIVPIRVLAQSPSHAPTNTSAPIVHGETVFMDKELVSIQVPSLVDFFTPAIWDEAAMTLLAQFSTVTLTADQWKLPKLSNYALRFFGAATNPLMPKTLQDKTTHATQEPKRQFSVAGRLCIYKNGSLIQNLVSTAYEIDTQTDNPENAAEFGEGGKFLGAAYVRGKVIPENDVYDYRKPEVAIDRSQPFECDATIATSDTNTDADTSQGQNRFVIPGLSTLPTIIQILWRLSPPGAACALEIIIPGFPDPLQVSCNTYSIVYKGTTLNPWVANTHCNIDGCEESELTTVDYKKHDPRFDDDVQTGGLANTFKPHVLSFTNKLHGGDPSQSISSGGQTFESPSALSFQGSLQDNSKGIMCSLLPKSLQTESCQFASSSVDCEGAFSDPEQVQNDNRSGGNGGNPNTEIGYAIPYRNTSCTIPESAIEDIASFARRWGGGHQQSYDNVTQYWQILQESAQEYGWNPAFVMSLWIEETAAGGIGASELGCLYRFLQSRSEFIRSEPHNICPQLACLFAYPDYAKDPNDYFGFLCRYSEGDAPQSVTRCPFVDNPTFPSRLRDVYQIVSDFARLGSSCRVRTP